MIGRLVLRVERAYLRGTGSCGAKSLLVILSDSQHKANTVEEGLMQGLATPPSRGTWIGAAHTSHGA